MWYPHVYNEALTNAFMYGTISGPDDYSGVTDPNGERYDRGHLLSSQFLRTFLGTQNNKNNLNIRSDVHYLGAHMANIFPQRVDCNEMCKSWRKFEDETI